MENILLIIFLYFIATIFSDRNKRKKRRMPPSGPPEQMPQQVPRGQDGAAPRRGVDFEIPHLEGAPPVPSADGVYHEEEDEASGKPAPHPERDLWQEYVERTRHAVLRNGAGSSETAIEASAGEAGKPHPILMDPQTALQAVALAEVLNRPKAYRKIRRYGR